RVAEHARANEAALRLIAEQKERDAYAEKVRAVAANNKSLDALRVTTDDVVEKLFGQKQTLGTVEKEFLEAALKRWQSFAEEHGDDVESRWIRAEGLGR